MAENYVQIRIKASDTAKPELDSLRADLDELGAKVDTAKVKVDDDEAKAKLLALNAELAALNKKVANPRIDAAGAARAESQIERVRKGIDDLIKKSNSAPRGGILGKLLFGALGQLPGGGGGTSGSGSALGILGQLSGLVAAGGPIAVGLGAILVEADGLASGFAAAGAGVGAFAILAAPAFSKVSNAVTQLKTDQLAYSRATTAAARSTALQKIHDDWKALDPAERGAVRGIQEFEGSLSRMSKAFEPAAFKVFNDALKIANQLLPDLKPFADTAATALDGLLKQVSKFVGSTGFKDWLAQFQKLEGPSIKAIGEGIGQVAIAFGKLLTIMSSKDVVNAINIAFKILAGTIDALGFIIRRIMLRWDQWQKAFDQSRHAIATGAHDIAHVFDTMRHDIAAAVDAVRNRISQDIDHMRTDLVHWAQDVGQATARVVSWFRSLPGRVMSAVASLPGRLFSFGAHIISMLAAGIRSAIGDVTSAIGSIASEITSHLPFSPAKKGPLSGTGDPEKRGRKIAQLLAQGMAGGADAVSEAADRMTGAAVPHVGGLALAGGGGQIEVTLRAAGGDQLLAAIIRELRYDVRTKGGGNVQRYLGWGTA